MMWIRSQDENLLINVKAVTKEKTCKIFGWISNDCYFDIGEYDTEEEALKVIDEIEKLLEKQFYHKINSQYITAGDMASTIKTQYVYQMPFKRGN